MDGAPDPRSGRAPEAEKPVRPTDRTGGDVIIRANLAATAVFGVTAAYAAVSFSTTAQWVGAVTALSLFAVGVFAFLWSYWNAVQRSRTEEISVTQLYLLLGPAIPTAVRRTMNLTLLLQVVIATVTTFARPNGPDGNPGSSLAVGFLVPMLGFGLNGLWAAYHGTFSLRRLPEDHREPASTTTSTVDPVTTGDDPIGQNADHG